MSKLFEPLRIKDIELKNRIAVSPMCEYSSQDGFANDWHLVHLGSRAIGGAALVFTEATAVSPEGRISPDDLGIWKDEHIDFLKRITSFIHDHGSVAGVQLAHAGRKASVSSPWLGNKYLGEDERGWQPMAPSPVPFRDDTPLPHELSKEEIKKVARDFAQAAVRAKEAGFKVVEVHAAHGYLLNQFLSPISNKRQDEYGGSFENRIRLTLEVIDAVKKGVDLVDCSSGGNVSRAKVEIGPMYQVPFAEKVKKGSGILTAAVGLITTAQQCEEIISEGRADMVFLARQLLRDPYFPLHAAKELNEDVEWPNQYLRAK